MDLLNTSQAAEVLGVSERRVRALIAGGKLLAQRVGRDYVIRQEDIALVGDRKPGRPAKQTEGDDQSGESETKATSTKPTKKRLTKKASKKD